MREIKFRVWVKKSWNNNEWIKDRMFYNVFLDKHCVRIRSEELSFAYKDECILMQYIGLKDKNGVEIYEGDIIESEYSGEYFEVKFSYGEYVGHNSNFKNGLLSVNGLMRGEVIGNIHDK